MLRRLGGAVIWTVLATALVIERYRQRRRRDAE